MYQTEYFPEPVAYNFGEQLIKVPGLDGSLKMSKSDNENSCIFLSDSPDLIRKKVMKAVTDSGPVELNQKKPQSVENLFSLMEIVSTRDTINHFEDMYNNCSIRYGDLKKQLAEDMVNFVGPLSEKIKALASDQDYVARVARTGAEKARESASKTIREVREIIGFSSPAC